MILCATFTTDNSPADLLMLCRAMRQTLSSYDLEFQDKDVSPTDVMEAPEGEKFQLHTSPRNPGYKNNVGFLLKKGASVVLMLSERYVAYIEKQKLEDYD